MTINTKNTERVYESSDFRIVRESNGSYWLLTARKVTAKEADAVIEEAERKREIAEWHAEEASVGLL